MIDPVSVNYLAVLAASVVSMLIGWAWYSPMVLGKQWMKEVGKRPEEIKKDMQGKAMAMAFVATLIMAYVLAHFVQYVTAVTLGDGVQLGFWIWLGFIAPVVATSVFFDGKSWKWFAITGGYQLVNAIVMAAILAMWS